MQILKEPNPLPEARRLLGGQLALPEPLLLLCSGGSALDLLDAAWPTFPHLTLGVLDERLEVEPHNTNRFRLEQTAFYTKQQAPFLELSEENLRNWKGRIICTQGIGADGHTAGLFPGTAGLEGPEWVKDFDVENQFPKRRSVTFTFLRQVDVSLVYAVGAEKIPALEKVLAKQGDLAETPARIIWEMPEVVVALEV